MFTQCLPFFLALEITFNAFLLDVQRKTGFCSFRHQATITKQPSP